MNPLEDMDLRVELLRMQRLVEAAQDALADEREGDLLAAIEQLSTMALLAYELVRSW